VSVYVYHGAGRTKDVEELKKHSIVITTYNILATEYRDEDSANRKKPGRKARAPLASSSSSSSSSAAPTPSSFSSSSSFSSPFFASGSSSSSSSSSSSFPYAGLGGSLMQSALARFPQFSAFARPSTSASSVMETTPPTSGGTVPQSPLQEVHWLRYRPLPPFPFSAVCLTCRVSCRVVSCWCRACRVVWYAKNCAGRGPHYQDP
jgi:hypothetical protein